MYKVFYNEQGKRKELGITYQTEQEAQKSVIQLRSIHIEAWYYSIRKQIEKAKKNIQEAKETIKRATETAQLSLLSL